MGKALGEKLTNSGYKVYGTSRRPQPDTFPFTLLTMDVTRPETIETTVREIISREGRIDVLVNNAGVGMAYPIEEVPLEHVQQLFDTNVFGALRVSQTVLPHMRAARRGKIINISSVGSVVGLPYRGIYCASKAALDMLTTTLRMEVRRFNIEVTSILAGDIRTNIKDHWVARLDNDDSPYAESFDRVVNTAGAQVDQGTPPEIMAAQIEAVIRAGRLKGSYALGKPMQRLSLFIKRILPAAWFERIIMNYAKL